MKAETKIFGAIDIDDNKVIHFEHGIVGFPDLKDFALIYDVEAGGKSPIKWLQSMTEPSFAMPVINPLLIAEDYNPCVEDELLKPIGNLESGDMLVLVTLTVPKEIEKMSVNLQAPIVINSANCKACQIIVDGDNYPIKFPIYAILKKNREEGE